MTNKELAKTIMKKLDNGHSKLSALEKQVKEYINTQAEVLKAITNYIKYSGERHLAYESDKVFEIRFEANKIRLYKNLDTVLEVETLKSNNNFLRISFKSDNIFKNAELAEKFLELIDSAIDNTIKDIYEVLK